MRRSTTSCNKKRRLRKDHCQSMTIPSASSSVPVVSQGNIGKPITALLRRDCLVLLPSEISTNHGSSPVCATGQKRISTPPSSHFFFFSSSVLKRSQWWGVKPYLWQKRVWYSHECYVSLAGLVYRFGQKIYMQRFTFFGSAVVLWRKITGMRCFFSGRSIFGLGCDLVQYMEVGWGMWGQQKTSSENLDFIR